MTKPTLPENLPMVGRPDMSKVEFSLYETLQQALSLTSVATSSNLSHNSAQIQHHYFSALDNLLTKAADLFEQSLKERGK